MMHPEYRRLWVAAGYPSTIGSAAVVKPPSKTLRRVYHLNSAEYAISDIGLGHLKVARFSDLNDPFELLALNLREVKTRNIIRGFKEAYDAETGLLCFSGDWTNPVLWSHYANKHRGICLGFDVEKTALREVSYRQERILSKLRGRNSAEKLSAQLQNQLINTKYKHWEYEDEYRMFIDLNKYKRQGALYFVEFGELRLREVILGPLCNMRVKDVRALVNARYRGVVTFKARLAYKYFKVVPNNRTVP